MPDMYIDLPDDYVDPSTQTPLPSAAMVVSNVEVRSRAGEALVTAMVFATPELIGRANPVSEQVLSALSMDEIAQVSPQLLEALYGVLLARPGYEGAELVGGAQLEGAYTGTWTWDTTSGSFHRGELRSDTNAWPDAASLTISAFTSTGYNGGAALGALLVAGNRIQLQQKAAVSPRALYDILADAAETTIDGQAAWSVMVSLSSGSGDTPIDSRDVLVSVLTAQEAP